MRFITLVGITFDCSCCMCNHICSIWFNGFAVVVKSNLMSGCRINYASTNHCPRWDNKNASKAVSNCSSLSYGKFCHEKNTIKRLQKFLSIYRILVNLQQSKYWKRATPFARVCLHPVAVSKLPWKQCFSCKSTPPN